MVLTRRARSINSVGNNDDDTGSFTSARGSVRRSAPSVPPPPPPPPPPPQPQQPEPYQPADTHAPAPANNADLESEEHLMAPLMAPIPEEVAVNNNIDHNSGIGSQDNIVEENSIINEMNNNNNNNNNNAAPMAQTQSPPPPPPPPVQYLRVRVPPPSQSTRWPSRIHRRHHRQSSNNNGPNHDPRYNRSRIKGRHHPSPSSRNNAEGEIVRLLIPPNGFASEQQLAECLSQAGASDFSSQDDPLSGRFGDLGDDEYSMDEYFDDRRETTRVAGMFCERDRVFVPLSVIYSNPTSFVREVLCLQRPPPPRRPAPQPIKDSRAKRRSIFLTFLELVGIAVVSAASYWVYGAAQLVDWDYFWEEWVNKMGQIMFAILNFPFWLFDAVIEYPLRELYRHGPSIIGWEGQPLPRICAQITYHGDESFWSRNIEECERIYYAKESAALQVRKPIVIVSLLFVAFYVVKEIIAARALRMRERIDPNMVETYRAIHMLTRQLRRAMNAR
eukprot:CAMPEP_0183736884 /NCGR_PEP_ID=MMETSP0737-20130205/50498_1 /TAXON_ID=385413 /ORGANISM="Thalassiosira miniscula, Strain CCMP1093" /LENGTH=501 /DNA_ID=CAMNT_0025971013 /DNA_START=39 /DNA_END=1544 /DNA_ORIENTATION=+